MPLGAMSSAPDLSKELEVENMDEDHQRTEGFNGFEGFSHDFFYVFPCFSHTFHIVLEPLLCRNGPCRGTSEPSEVVNELRYGGAKYVATGRGLPTYRRPFIGETEPGTTKLKKAHLILYTSYRNYAVNIYICIKIINHHKSNILWNSSVFSHFM